MGVNTVAKLEDLGAKRSLTTGMVLPQKNSVIPLKFFEIFKNIRAESN